VQVAAPHVVDELGYVHEPVVTPSQVGPHLVPAPVPEHAGRVPWGAPTTAVHLPTLPPTSHAWHAPPQAVSQQTPSTQLPDPHSEPAVHAVPLAFVQCPGEPGRLHE